MMPYYIKKEDARYVADWQRKLTAIIMMGITGVIAVLQWSVTPRLHELYEQLRTPLPASTAAAELFQWLLGGICLAFGLQLLTTTPDYRRIDSLVKPYKKGEMIMTNRLIDQRLNWLFLIVLLPIAAVVFGTILPIYHLTANM